MTQKRGATVASIVLPRAEGRVPTASGYAIQGQREGRVYGIGAMPDGVKVAAPKCSPALGGKIPHLDYKICARCNRRHAAPRSDRVVVVGCGRYLNGVVLSTHLHGYLPSSLGIITLSTLKIPGPPVTKSSRRSIYVVSLRYNQSSNQSAMSIG